MMKCLWCVVLCLLYISPLVDAGQTNSAKLQQAKQQLQAKAAKQQKQQQQIGLASGQRQQNIKLSGVKPVVLPKTSIGQKPTGTKKQSAGLQQKPVQKQLLKQQPKQQVLKPSLQAKKIKSPEVKISAKKQPTVKQPASGKKVEPKQPVEEPKTIKRPKIYIQPIQSKQELQRATLALRCDKRKNYYCINETTCCITAQGEWGCCPKPGAVCCQDKTHCCPGGTSCDLRIGECRGKSGNSPLMKKIAAVRLPADHVICPDHRSSCPDFYTCCPSRYGGFQCCPAPQAMCCPDKTHCCPHGSKCNPRRGQCERGSAVNIPWYSKVPARPVAFGQQICPGGQYECPTGSTCCRLTSGDWGCCPLPQAVCCEDGDHCCPQGYSCNQKFGTCQRDGKGLQFVKWMNVTDKFGLPPKPPNTICPSGKFKCPSDQSCCPRKGGLYGCCPFSQGVCCSDEKHCCPPGYKCDLGRAKCVKAKGGTTVLTATRAALDIRVPTSYEQLQNMLNTGYLPAPSIPGAANSPIFTKIPGLSKLQPQKIQIPVNVAGHAGAQKQKQQPNIAHQHIKVQQTKSQKPFVQAKTQVKQQVNLKQQQQMKQRAQQQKQPKINVPLKKNVIQNKPVVQKVQKLNVTPKNQKNMNVGSKLKRVDLKKADPKIAEASRKAKIAVAVNKNAQILRKLHSVEFNMGIKPTANIKVRPKPEGQRKAQQVVKQQQKQPVMKQKPQLSTKLTPEQIKIMQQQKLKNVQLNQKRAQGATQGALKFNVKTSQKNVVGNQRTNVGKKPMQNKMVRPKI